MKILIILLITFLPTLLLGSDETKNSIHALQKILEINPTDALPKWKDNGKDPSLKEILSKIDSLNPNENIQSFESLVVAIGVLSEVLNKYASASSEIRSYDFEAVQIASSALRATQKIITYYENNGVDILQESSQIKDGFTTSYIGYVNCFIDEDSFGHDEYEVMVNTLEKHHRFYFSRLSDSAKSELNTTLEKMQSTHQAKEVRKLAAKLLNANKSIEITSKLAF